MINADRNEKQPAEKQMEFELEINELRSALETMSPRQIRALKEFCLAFLTTREEQST